VLRRTARDVGAPGRDDVYGWGIPDAPALLTALLPPHRFVRGTADAQSWSKVSTDSVTLSKTRMAVNGCSIDGRYLAERWEVRTHVTLPPGLLLETPQVIGRVHGTNGQGGWPNAQLLEYDGLDFSEAIPGTVTRDGFDLRTYVYLISAPPPTCSVISPIDYVPHEPRDVRFAWSALGRCDAAPRVTITAPASGATVAVDLPSTIVWNAFDPDSVTTTQVAVSRDSGATWATIANLPGNPGSLEWRAPCGHPGADYLLRVRALDQRGGVADEGEATVAFVPDRLCLDGEDPDTLPGLALLPPTPNPASNGPTQFRFNLPEANSATSLRLYDLRGRLVRTIALAQALAGPNIASWDGRDDRGALAPAGMYIARLTSAGEATTTRFVRL